MAEHLLPITRRQLLGLGGAMGVTLAGGLTAGGFLADRPSATGAMLQSTARLPEPYTVPLPIPDRAVPTETLDGADSYEMVQRAATAEILPGLNTSLWTYDGLFPGPTLESRRGRTVRVRHRNELVVPTVVHLHGGRTPAESDGYPTDLVLPEHWQTSGEHGGHGAGMADPRAVTSTLTREYTYPLDQRAALLWYHDHRMDFTAPAIWRGLAGMHIVRDNIEDALDLPRDERELPLMLTDRAFDADGTMPYPSLDPALLDLPGVEEKYMGGVLGDVILVNGAPWPVHEVDAAHHRLRLLNASNARHYDLEAVTEDGRHLPLVQVGADQGLLERPVSLKSLPIAPAERYDLMIDFSAVPIGARVRLRNRLGSGRTREVMAFLVARPGRGDTPVPAVLDPGAPTWDRAEATTVRELEFRTGPTMHGRGWVIGGAAYDPARTDVETSLGAIEIWRLTADVHHPVHLHLAPFRILSRGAGLLPHDSGLKDTIALRPGETAEILPRFDGYRGRYMFHCHNAEHEDMGMMANLAIR